MYTTARSCTRPTHHKTVSGDTQSCTRPTHHKTSSGDTQSCTRPFLHIALPPGIAPDGECNEVADVQPKYLTHSTQCLGGIWLVIPHVDYPPPHLVPLWWGNRHASLQANYLLRRALALALSTLYIVIYIHICYCYYLCIHICTYVSMYVYVCMYICICVCKYVCIYIHIYREREQ